MHTSFHDLKDATVFITGGGSGIGAALTDAFLSQGSKVAFIGRKDASKFCDLMEKKHHTRPLFLQGDITNTKHLKATMDKVVEEHGSLHCLINNAANDERHSTAEVTPEFWDNMISINLKAYFFACQHAAALMKQTGGSIINFTSISYMMGNVGYPIYSTSNSGINGMTRSLAREFGPNNIRVNALAPGWVLTQKQRDYWVTDEALAAHIDRQCLRKPLTPNDITGACLFLASNASKMMTGQAMVIDGGVVTTG